MSVTSENVGSSHWLAWKQEGPRGRQRGGVGRGGQHSAAAQGGPRSSSSSTSSRRRRRRSSRIIIKFFLGGGGVSHLEALEKLPVELVVRVLPGGQGPSEAVAAQVEGVAEVVLRLPPPLGQRGAQSLLRQPQVPPVLSCVHRKAVTRGSRFRAQQPLAGQVKWKGPPP